MDPWTHIDLNGITTFCIGVVTAFVTSILLFPMLPLQHWLISRILLFWNRVIKRHPHGITGRWLSLYQTPETGARMEIVKCIQISGGEVRGTIIDERSNDRWKFIGHLVEDEMVAHYWSSKETKDMGDFKLTFHMGLKGFFTASGPMTLYISVSKTTLSNVNYSWYRYPNAKLKMNRIRAEHSGIEGDGLFSNVRFEHGEEIGEVRLGRRAAKGGKNTVEFKGQHRIVAKPWRFLNHSCAPNARLDQHGDRLTLVALKDILPQTELTIDYRLLPEGIVQHFDCRCEKCKALGKPAKI